MCKEDGCKNKEFLRGYCQKHYSIFLGTDKLPRLKFRNVGRICYAKKCNKKAVKVGLCENHYQLLRNNGDPNKKSFEYHGMSKWPEYRVWNTMKYRCFNPNSDMYHRYGGRGIIVCERWKNSFSNFIKDMGRRPSSNHQIDRIDNDGNYEPENCRWVTPSENRLNQDPRVVTEGMRAKLLSDRLSGMSYQSIAEKNNLPLGTVYYAIGRK